jgi:hypothetical protein
MKLKEYQKNLYIKPSLIHGAGLGCFANVDIPVGTCLGWYRGKFLSRREWKNIDDDSYIWMIEPGTEVEDSAFPADKLMRYYIDAKPIKHNNKLRYVNGAKLARQYFLINCEAYQHNEKIYYETIKKIKKGMEIIVNYGCDYY